MDGIRADVTVQDAPVTVDASCIAFPGRSGQGVRVAVIDSGVHASHPHIGRVAGGVAIGQKEDSFVDLIGHGTAVMAAIQEKAPQAEYFAVRVFHTELRARIDVIVSAVEWCIERRMDVINLSLGTANPAHEARFAALIARAAEHGTIVVSARNTNGIAAFPGSLMGVVGVGLDWNCPRYSYSCRRTPEGLVLCASGYPRPIPDVPKERNLQGISFAVANMTGFVARACQGLEHRSHGTVCSALAAEAERIGLNLK